MLRERESRSRGQRVVFSLLSPPTPFIFNLPLPSRLFQPPGAPTPPPAISASVSRSQARREAAEDAALAAAADGVNGAAVATSSATPADPKLAEFFSEVAAIKTQLAGIRDAQAALSRAHEQSKTVTRGKEMTAIRERMQVRMNGWMDGWMERRVAG